MSIVASVGWQDILDELEKPNRQYTVRQASSILKTLARKYHKQVRETAASKGDSGVPIELREKICETLCRGAVEEIKRKAA